METKTINPMRGRLAELGITISRFAEEIKISKNRAFAILDGVRPYKAHEIERACALLDIPAEKIPYYFFGAVKPDTRGGV